MPGLTVDASHLPPIAIAIVFIQHIRPMHIGYTIAPKTECRKKHIWPRLYLAMGEIIIITVMIRKIEIRLTML